MCNSTNAPRVSQEDTKVFYSAVAVSCTVTAGQI